MTRYINDFQTSKSDDEIREIVTHWLDVAGFVQAKYRRGLFSKSEIVWKKDNGRWLAPGYFKFESYQGKVHIEAFIFRGRYGETGFEIVKRGDRKSPSAQLESFTQDVENKLLENA